MNPLNPPQKFIVDNRFRHHHPEYIREIARSYGFERKQEAGLVLDEKGRARRQSEVWMLVNENGWWFIRMDDQGHPPYHFGSRPHYHKEWLDDQDKANDYLQGPGLKAYAYDDAGLLLGKIGKKDESKVKLSHIPR
jgi:hypothetical protein